ncbi:MAG: hypothetical protein HFI29_11805 [Lachnospiraceae bacterium]|nr:hypothetical protein [Lachnospiraceae bacterium]
MRRKELYRSRKLPLFLALSLSFMFGGCTLARPELQMAEEEQLCGILAVTGEQEAQQVKEQSLEGRSFLSKRELEEALTAELIVEGVYRKEEHTFAFEGVEGHVLGVMEEGEPPTIHFVNDGFFTGVEANTTVTDTGREDTISGTILVMQSLNEPVYLYPVYGRSDGSYYAVLDSGGVLMNGVHDEGEVYSQNYHWETVEEFGGEKETRSTSITVSVEAGIPVKRVQVRMYDENNGLLETKELSGKMRKVRLPEETAYIIVEEETVEGAVKRSLYNREETEEELVHVVHYPGRDGLIDSQEIVFFKAGTT